MKVPRLRMFAGPKGSGKSTIKSVVPPELLGVYLNPDEIEKEIRDRDFLDLRAYGVETTREEVLPFFANSTLLANAGLDEEAECLHFSDGKLSFFEVIVNAYFASVAADFIRQKLLEKRVSFSFETVMSSPDKVVLLEKARSLGYRTYLYFIATEDPEINIARVKSCVHLGEARCAGGQSREPLRPLAGPAPARHPPEQPRLSLRQLAPRRRAPVGGGDHRWQRSGNQMLSFAVMVPAGRVGQNHSSHLMG